MAVTSAPAPTGLGRLALRRASRASRRRRTNPLLVAAFVLPSLLIYGLFMVYPFLGTIHLSLTSWDGFAATKDFIGLDNYRVLFQDGEFWEALSHNLIWAVIGTAAPIIIGLPIAVMLWSGARFRLGFRAMYFLPVILPSVVQGIIWGWIYNPIFGVLNSILEAVGLGQFTTGWLGNPDTALYAVLAAAVWATFGMVVVFFMAGLQGIYMNLVDAARLDFAMQACLEFWGALAPLPMVIVVSAALKDPNLATGNPFQLFSSIRLENFVDAWTLGNFGRYFFNTIVIMVPTVLGVIVFSTMTGYALARFEFPGRNALFYLFILGLMVPFFALMIPLYYNLNDYHLLDTPCAII